MHNFGRGFAFRACLSGATAVACLCGVALCQDPAQAPKPMARDAEPVFEVATIKPSPAGDGREGFHIDGRHVSADNEPVEEMMMAAYGVQASQVVGGPSWIADRRFNISGLADADGEPSLSQMQGMYRKLLADRFHLVFHREKRELAVYALRVAKSGPKLASRKGDPDNPGDENGWQNGGERTLEFTNASIALFVLNMQFMLSRPLVDQTDLQGRYDFVLRYTPDETKFPDSPVPGLFTAVQEQLGLKLEPVKAPADVLVIDSLEMPTEN
jgi:uncharacterized protein (TIGR03435 family)